MYLKKRRSKTLTVCNRGLLKVRALNPRKKFRNKFTVLEVYGLQTLILKELLYALKLLPVIYSFEESDDVIYSL